MSNNEKQGVYVGLITVIILVSGLVFFEHRSWEMHRRGLRASVESGLEYVFDRCVGTNSSASVDPSIMEGELVLPTHEVTTYLPGFVHLTNVLVSADSVRIPSDQLLFAVEMPNGIAYGITGRRLTRDMNAQDIRLWNHRRLK